MKHHLIVMRQKLAAARFPNLLKILALAAIVAASYSSTVAQGTRPSINPLGVDKSSPDDSMPFASFEEEIRAKQAIKFADKQYDENRERARDLSFLGSELSAAFKQKSFFSQEDFKKLEKAEKLVKAIRTSAGGSEDNVALDKTPKDFPSALKMFSELTESLNVKVEKTPKHVVSAAVIDEANVLLEVIRLLRSLPRNA